MNIYKVVGAGVHLNDFLVLLQKVLKSDYWVGLDRSQTAVLDAVAHAHASEVQIYILRTTVKDEPRYELILHWAALDANAAYSMRVRASPVTDELWRVGEPLTGKVIPEQVKNLMDLDFL